VKRLSAQGIKGEKHEKSSIFHAFLPQTPIGACKKSSLKDFLYATSRILKMCTLLNEKLSLFSLQNTKE